MGSRRDNRLKSLKTLRGTLDWEYVHPRREGQPRTRHKSLNCLKRCDKVTHTQLVSEGQVLLRGEVG